MSSDQKKIVLITGAAHGIGLSLTHLYEQAGYRVIGLDVNTQAIKKAEQETKHATYYTCDITSKEQVYSLSQEILHKHGTPFIVINNAGVVENAKFLDCPDPVLERTMKVNILSHFWILKAFLPAMIQNKKGHLCQIASAAGLMGVKGMAAYCASKHAVIGFSKSLRLELEAIPGVDIPVTIICPGFINTGMFQGIKKIRFTPLLDQEKIAKIIFKAINRKKHFVIEPFMVKTVPVLNALLPSRLFALVANILHVNQAMDDIVEK